MSVPCSLPIMAAVLMMPIPRLEESSRAGVLPSDPDGNYCFSSTVQRHLVALQIRAGQRSSGQASTIYPLELDGLTESIIKQQLEQIESCPQDHLLFIELPTDQDVMEVLDVIL